MRQIYEDVYSSGKSKKLPVKWMAPESLYQGLYTTKSDVWENNYFIWAREPFFEMFNYQKFGSGENSQIEVTNLNSLDVMQQFQWQTISGLYLIARNITVTLTPGKTSKWRGVKSNRKNGLSYLIVLKTDLWSQGTLRKGREEINFFFHFFFLIILDSCNQSFFRGLNQNLRRAFPPLSCGSLP